ncbi:MAG: PulJ/GspJ family protein [Planctomycetota bacterium]|jgi:prepilin-type N-terminal cleavage/methylation domain-containing protein
MRNTKYHIQNTSNEHAFTIAELLIALAITGLLLAAVAVAFNASVRNYSDNEDIFKTINSARQALSRITKQLRTADAVDPNSPDNECSLITAGGDDITYRYNNADNKLYLDSNSNSYVLCDNVTAMTFTKDTATVDAVTYVKSVQISMTVVSGNDQRTVSAAAVIRRNLQ